MRRVPISARSPQGTKLARDPLYFETATTLPVDFHSFRRAFSTALAEAGINVQHATHLAGALRPARARALRHAPRTRHGRLTEIRVVDAIADVSQPSGEWLHKKLTKPTDGVREGPPASHFDERARQKVTSARNWSADTLNVSASCLRSLAASRCGHA